MKILKIAACAIAGYVLAYLMVSFYWVSLDAIAWSEMGRFMLLMIGFWISFAIAVVSEAL